MWRGRKVGKGGTRRWGDRRGRDGGQEVKKRDDVGKGWSRCEGDIVDRKGRWRTLRTEWKGRNRRRGNTDTGNGEG